MFPYRVKYTESESDIKYFNLFYKNTKNAKILSKNWKAFENRKIKFLFCIMYKLYNSYFVFFVNFVNFVILGFWDFYLYTRIRVGLFMSWCRSLVLAALVKD